MPESGLPAEVEQFIADHVRTVEHLEVLLAVAAVPTHTVTAIEVFGTVRSSEASVRERLEELANEGLLTQHGEQFRLNPQKPNLPGTLVELGRAYKERSIRVIQMIYSDRRRAMRELSDAFRLRRKEKNG